MLAVQAWPRARGQVLAVPNYFQLCRLPDHRVKGLEEVGHPVLARPAEALMERMIAETLCSSHHVYVGGC